MREFVFHQSWLNTFFTCPEQARLQWNGTYPEDDSERAAIGTAVHAGIELVLNELALPDEAISHAFGVFRGIAERPHFRYVKTKKESTCLSHIEGAFASWWDFIYPDLRSSVWVEHSFKHLVYADEHRRIYWAGTVDYAEIGPEGARIDDWKVTLNKDKYGTKFGQDGWEQERWAIQPTVYGDAYRNQFGQMPSFRFVALDVAGREPQTLPVSRTTGQVEFLVDQCVNITNFIERNDPEHYYWPTNDQHALCSERWCLNWLTCKGAYVSVDTPAKLAS